jgi:hypothetical protein
MADEMAAMELIEAHDRIADLECSLESVQTTLNASLDALRYVTRERDQLRALIDHWTSRPTRRRR